MSCSIPFKKLLPAAHNSRYRRSDDCIFGNSELDLVPELNVGWNGTALINAKHRPPHGPRGLRRVAQNAVLNASYLLSRVKHFLPVPQGERCMHEFVASAQNLKLEKGISAMDIAKRLLDYGYHAPTVYFPLTVPEAMMVEPTETESKETLDAFAETLFSPVFPGKILLT